MDRLRNSSVQRPLARFRAFWQELDRAVDDIRSHRWAREAAAEGGAAHVTTDALFRRLRDAIAAQGGSAPPRYAYGQTPIDLGYIMAAVADETLLYLEAWNGMEQWAGTLLEERIYGTRIAGERLFEEVEAQLAQQTQLDEDISVGLLAALSLGFRGKYRLLPAVEAEAETGRLRNRLYRALFLDAAPAIIDWNDTMDYPPPFQEGQMQRMPRLYPWIGASIAAMALYVLLAHLIWLANLSLPLSIADQVAQYGALGLI